LRLRFRRLLHHRKRKREADLCRSSSDSKLPGPSAAASKEIPETQGSQAANLACVPEAQKQNVPASSSLQPQDQSSAVLFLPIKTSQHLSFSDKFTIYAHQTFGPPAVVFPAFAAGMGMANPRNHYPRDWKDGGGVFGRLYGDSIAMTTSGRTARFLTGVALHQDPRYLRSNSKNPLMRTITQLRLLSSIRPTPGETPLPSPILLERLPAVLSEMLICHTDITISHTQSKE
jgi:hypothetical protein